jgi:phosphoribosylanthranilate isomerase
MTVRIKICGITNPHDAHLASELGADMIGLNFYVRSPRYISMARAWEILRATVACEAVGVFVNEPLGQVEKWLQGTGIISAQLHGDHAEIPPSAFRVFPAFSIRGENSLTEITAYLERVRSAHATDPPAILVDAHVPGMHGGTGKTAPWRLLAGFDPGVPVILAGGLTPDNVVEAIRIVRPWGVDVASGVESAPGQKDPEKMRRFIENARAAI